MILKMYPQKYPKYTYPKKYLKCKKYTQHNTQNAKSIPKNTLSPCIYVDTACKPVNQAAFTPLKAGLNFHPKNTIYSHFMTVTNINHWQMITQNNT